MGTLRNRILWIGSALLVLILLIASVFVPNIHKLTMSQEDRLAMTYHQFTEDDYSTDSENVKFLAFFARDINKDGYAEKLAGTTLNMNNADTLYMDINVLSDGTLKNGKITLSNGNFKYSMSMIKDAVLANNCIGEDVKNIQLNDLRAGTQGLLQGSIKSKLSSSNKTTVTLTGLYVPSGATDEQGIQINKEIELTVDWYGSVSASILPHSNKQVKEWLISEDRVNNEIVNLSFYTEETMGQIPLKESSVTVKVPTLYGYYPTDVKMSNGIYDSENHTITVTRSAQLDDDGKVISGLSNKSYYEVKAYYPNEAYRIMYEKWLENTEEPTSTTLSFRIDASYIGSNNGVYDDAESATSTFATVIVQIGADDPQGGPEGFLSVDFENKTYMQRSKRYGIDKDELLSAWQDGEYYYYTIRYNYIHSSNNTEITDKKITLSMQYPDKFGTDALGNIATFYGIYIPGFNTTLFENDAEVKMFNSNDELVGYFTRKSNKLVPVGDEENWFEDTQLGKGFKADNYYVLGGSEGLNSSVPLENLKIELTGVKETDYYSTRIQGKRYGSVIGGALDVYVIKRIKADELTEERINRANDLNTYANSVLTYKEVENNHSGSVVSNDADTIDLVTLKSFAGLDINNPVFMAQEDDRTRQISIHAGKDQFGDADWKNGVFAIEIPEQVIKMEIEDITSSDVTIRGWDLEKVEGKYYIKVYTENKDAVSKLDILIRAEMTVNPKAPIGSGIMKLYFFNQEREVYYSKTEDIFDLDNDGRTDDFVGYSTYGIKTIAPTTMVTYQVVSNYDNEGSITVAPNIAEITKETRTANIDLTVLNGYRDTVTGTKILGRVPYQDNKYVLTDRYIGSDFSATMNAGGITVPDSIASMTKVYYSAEETPTIDLENAANAWKTADQVTDWSSIKSYLIDFSELTLYPGATYNFTYGVSIPEGLDYNENSYGTHAIFYEYNSPNGKIELETEPEKVGIKVARKYNFDVVKYKEGTTRPVVNAVYTLTCKNSVGEIESKRTVVTDTEGRIKIKNLYVNAEYTLEEISSPDDYILNTNKIVFKVVENADGSLSVLTLSTTGFSSDAVVTNENNIDVLHSSVENPAKYQLNIKYIDITNNEPIVGAVANINEQAAVSDENGIISLYRFMPNTEYLVQEQLIKGFTLENHTVKLVKENGNYSLDASEHIILESIVNDNENDLIQVNVRVEKMGTPRFDLDIVKVSKNGKTDLSKMEKIANATFAITRVDDNEYSLETTDENGVIELNDLYQYVIGSSITGKYKIKEETAPSGFALNPEEIVLKVTTENDELKVDIENLAGLTSIKDVQIDGKKVTLIIQDTPLFRLIKTDAQTGEPLANAKFVIRELIEIRDNNNEVVDYQVGDYAKDINDNYVGELNEAGQYVVVSEEDGLIQIPLKDGKYQIEEIEAPEGYIGGAIENFEVKNGIVADDEEEEEEDDFIDIYTVTEKANTLEINYIEDLLDLGNAIAQGNTYSDTKVVLMRNLDFTSDEAYRNPTDTATYGDYNGDETIEGIKEELSKGTGFRPMGGYIYVDEWDYNGQHYSRTEFKVDKEFSGVFDGQNHKIENIESHNEQYNGLFAFLRNAVIENLEISGTYTASSWGYSGGFASMGAADLTFINCTNNVNIGGNGNNGGFIGYISTQYFNDEDLLTFHKLRAINCTNNGTIASNGGSVGGFLGSSDYTGNRKDYDLFYIKNFVNKGTVSGSYSGGLIGRFTLRGPSAEKVIRIEDCVNEAENINGQTYAAGMIGDVEISGKEKEMVIKNCYNKANLNSSSYGSGIIGYYSANDSDKGLKIINCTNEGRETGYGGLLGYVNGRNIEKITVKNCVNRGNGSGNITGGVVGYISGGKEAEIINCYNYGNITGGSQDGGILGYVQAETKTTITNCHNAGNMTCGGFEVGGMIGCFAGSGKDLTITDCSNSGNIQSGSGTTGGMIGRIAYANDVKVENCYNAGEISSNSSSVGGIIGGDSGRANSLTIDKCYNTGKISCSGGQGYIGGIAGWLSGSPNSMIKNSYNIGEIFGQNGSWVAGIMGYGQSDIENCYNKGKIDNKDTSSYQAVTAGISGYKAGSTKNCINYANIYTDNTGTSSTYLGGIIGFQYNAGTTENCFNYGNIFTTFGPGANGCYVGGVAGATWSYPVEKSFNKGNILVINDSNTNNSSYIGGINGYSYNKISESYNTGKIQAYGKNASYVGGIVGNGGSCTITNCYNESDIEGGNYLGGIAGYAGTIKNSYSLASVTSISNNPNVGTYAVQRAGLIATGCNGIYCREGDSNVYYIDTAEVKSTNIEQDQSGHSATWDEMISDEFYDTLNTDGVWIKRDNLPPTLNLKLPIIEDTNELNILNNKEEYIIKTQVEGVGGTISGSNEIVYETLQSGTSNRKAISAAPSEDYTLVKLSVNGRNLAFETEDDGTFTLPAGYFENIDENKLVVASFGKDNVVTITKEDEETHATLPGAELRVSNYPSNWEEQINDKTGPMTNSDIDTEYHFELDQDGWYKSTNEGIANSLSHSYIPLDLRELKGEYSIAVQLYLNSQNSKDYGYIYVTESTETPTYNSTEGYKLMSGAGNWGEIDQNVAQSTGQKLIIPAGKMYYLHFGYYKDASGDSGLDVFKVKNIRVRAESVIDETVTTNEQGIAQVNYSPDYIWSNDVDYIYVKEIKAPEGYMLDNVDHEYPLDDTMAITVKNKEKSKVTVHYYLKENGVNTTKKVAEDDIYRGDIGEEYKAQPKVLEGLSLEKYPNGDYIIPTNATGTFTDEDVEVIYYYVPNEIELTIHHYMEGTLEKLAEDEVISTPANVTFDNDGNYSLSVDESYVLDENTNYQRLTAGEYALVSVDSTVEDDLAIDDTLSYTTDAELTYNYKKKEYIISTRVNKHEEVRTNVETGEEERKFVAGGTISGDGMPIYETVDVGEDATKDIIATADEGYIINRIIVNSKDDNGNLTSKEIYGDNAVTGEVTATGTNKEITLSRFQDVSANKEVIVEFVPMETKVIVHHQIVNREDDYRTEVLLGNVGNPYITHELTIKGHKLVNKSSNTEGVFAEEDTNVYYIYEPIDSKIIVRYIDVNTNEVLDEEEANGKYGEELDVKPYKKDIEGYTLVEEPDERYVTFDEDIKVVVFKYARNMIVRAIYVDTEGNKISEDVVINGYEGKSYQTQSKDIDGYELIKIPENATGTMTIGEDGKLEIIVKYEYRKIVNTKVVEKYVDINSKEVVDSKDHAGNVGDEYEIVPTVPKGYVLLEKDKEGKDILPKNTKGTMTEEVIEVVFYIAKEAKVKARYVIKYEGKDIADEVIIPGYEGKEYSVDAKDIDGYELIEIDGNPEGTMKAGENVVTFYYAKKATGIIPQTGINVFLYAMFAIAIIVVANGTVFIVYKMKK